MCKFYAISALKSQTTVDCGPTFVFYLASTHCNNNFRFT